MFQFLFLIIRGVSIDTTLFMVTSKVDSQMKFKNTMRVFLCKSACSCVSAKTLIKGKPVSSWFRSSVTSEPINKLYIKIVLEKFVSANWLMRPTNDLIQHDDIELEIFKSSRQLHSRLFSR